MRSLYRALAVVGALALSACNTVGMVVSPEQLSAAKQDVQLACSLRDAVTAASFDAGDAADLLCALASTEVPALGFDPRDATAACVRTEQFADADEWQAVCPDRVSGDVMNILRSMTAAEAYFRTIDPDYRIPTTVLFTGSTVSPCGKITVAAYCPADLFVYIDPDAIEAYSPTSEVRAAYITWHEIAHHFQDVNRDLLFDYGGPTDHTRSVELGADCYAGAIAAYVGADEAQAMEGLRMARLIGGSAEGTHGDGAMRAAAVTRGFRGGVC